MEVTADQFVLALNKHAPQFGLELSEGVISDLRNYYGIIQTWNARLHLVAPCSPEEFAVRHVLESLLTIKYVGPNAHVVDIGSGGGLPIIPCLIARQDIHSTLIESSPRKSIFLREALRNAYVHDRATLLASKYEDVPVTAASVVTCRALERFTTELPSIVKWSPVNSTLILFGGPSLRTELENANLEFTAVLIPESVRRFIFITKKSEVEAKN